MNTRMVAIGLMLLCYSCSPSWAQKPRTTKVTENATGKTISLTYVGGQLTADQVEGIFNIIYPVPPKKLPPDPIFKVLIDGVQPVSAFRADGVLYVPLREFAEKNGMSLTVSPIVGGHVDLHVSAQKTFAASSDRASDPVAHDQAEIYKAALKRAVASAYAEGFLAGRKADPAGLPITTKVVESKIDGDFEGWDGDTIFKLSNGQIWQQTDSAYSYHYSFMPDVIIYPSGSVWKMKVEGADDTITVTRLK